MSKLDELLEQPPRSNLPLMARLVMMLLAGMMVWAFFARVEEVSVAQGEIVPQEQIQTIQHLEGGIIEKIHVKEGGHVSQGEELMQLNITSFVANKEELMVNLEGLKLKRLRLMAEARGDERLSIPNENGEYRPELVHSEIMTFEGNRRRLESSLSVLHEQVQQKELDVTQLETERASIKKNLNVLREKMRISNELIKDKLTSKLDHLQLESEVQELTGRLEIIDVAIPRSRAALKETKERLRSEEVTYQNQAQELLRDTELEIARSQEMLTRATDQVLRTTIKSPIDGVVKSLKNHTLGGVVKPGEVIMEIVPISDNLVVEARLNPNDVGFVTNGQHALVKVNTYDYMRFGGLEGTVQSVSADSYTDEKSGEIYFEVIIRTNKNYLGDLPGQLPITPGMQASADIKTGSKTVMQYLLKPLLKVTSEAFRER